MGSTKLLQVGLGKTQVDEYQDNLSLLSATLSGAVGLFFTSLPHTEVCLHVHFHTPPSRLVLHVLANVSSYSIAFKSSCPHEGPMQEHAGH